MISKPDKFTLIAPLSCFPSDNKLDAMPRRDRIAIKSKLKHDAFVLGLAWLSKRKIKPNSLNKKSPLFNAPVRLKLTVYLAKGMTCDLTNLSEKSFLDQIVAMGIIADDSVKHIPECVTKFGGWQSGGSYAEFTLEVIGK
jgi:hypothetical protein